MKSDLRPTGSSNVHWVTLGLIQGTSQSFSGLHTKAISGFPGTIVVSRAKDGSVSSSTTPKLQRLRSTKPSKRLERLKVKAYRSAVAREHVTNRVAIQLRTLRENAGLTQAELARRIGTRQSVIARLESMSYGKFSISTLQKVADYFDVVAWVEFAPWSSLLRRTADLSPKSLTPASYSEEFDVQGEPSLNLTLSFDGSTICQSNYSGTTPELQTMRGATVVSTSEPHGDKN